jgi:hypothetical protein
MIAILTLVMIMFLSLLATRVATAILMHTGMSRDNARFQARSAWTNSGFTTSRSECMVNHPVRRRVLMVLMLLGNVGLATTTAAFIVGMADDNSASSELILNTGILLAGIILLLYLSRSRLFAKTIDALFDHMMNKFLRSTKPGVHYLCHFSDDYKLLEIEISPGHRFAGKLLSELKICDYGITLLQLISPDNNVNRNPAPDQKLAPGMKLVLFGYDKQIGAMLENTPRKRG